MSSPRIIKIEPGVRPSKCVGKALGGTCEARIYWVRELDPRFRKWRNIPVSVEARGLQAPSVAKTGDQPDLFSGAPDVHEGFGVDHMLSCPDRARIARHAAERAEERRA